jgi:hypothetical protein
MSLSSVTPEAESAAAEGAAAAARAAMAGIVAAHNAARMRRVVSTLQALGGHVTGDYVVHAVLLGTPADVEVVECSLPVGGVQHVEHVLALDFRVERMLGASTLPARELSVRVARSAIGDGGPRLYRLSAKPTRLARAVGGSLALVIVPFHQSAPRCGRPNADIFDWQLLAATRTQLYVTPVVPGLGHASASAADGISFDIGSLSTLYPLIERARNRTFCLVEQREGTTTHATAFMMLHASRMVGRGWSMDDDVCARRAWTVNLWNTMLRTPSSVRSDALARSLTKHPVCPICHEAFRPGDVVVNLPCNHNYHVTCPRPTAACTHGHGHGQEQDPEHEQNPEQDAEQSSTGNDDSSRGISLSGITAWLVVGHDTCPLCRARISFD